MVSRAELKVTSEKLSHACRDFVCAVNENPQAFKNVRFNATRNHAPMVQDNSLRHAGILGVTALWLSKIYLTLGGHI